MYNVKQPLDSRRSPGVWWTLQEDEGWNARLVLRWFPLIGILPTERRITSIATNILPPFQMVTKKKARKNADFKKVKLKVGKKLKKTTTTDTAISSATTFPSFSFSFFFCRVVAVF